MMRDSELLALEKEWKEERLSDEVLVKEEGGVVCCVPAAFNNAGKVVSVNILGGE